MVPSGKCFQLLFLETPLLLSSHEYVDKHIWLTTTEYISFTHFTILFWEYKRPDYINCWCSSCSKSPWVWTAAFLDHDQYIEKTTGNLTKTHLYLKGTLIMKTMFVDLGKKADIELSFFFFWGAGFSLRFVSFGCHFLRVTVDDLFWGHQHIHFHMFIAVYLLANQSTFIYRCFSSQSFNMQNCIFSKVASHVYAARSAATITSSLSWLSLFLCRLQDKSSGLDVPLRCCNL